MLGRSWLPSSYVAPEQRVSLSRHAPRKRCLRLPVCASAEERRAALRDSILRKGDQPPSNAYNPKTKKGGRILLVFSDGSGQDMLRQVEAAIKEYNSEEDGRYLPRWSNVSRMFLSLVGTPDDPSMNFSTLDHADDVTFGKDPQRNSSPTLHQLFEMEEDDEVDVGKPPIAAQAADDTSAVVLPTIDKKKGPLVSLVKAIMCGKSKAEIADEVGEYISDITSEYTFALEAKNTSEKDQESNLEAKQLALYVAGIGTNTIRDAVEKNRPKSVIPGLGWLRRKKSEVIGKFVVTSVLGGAFGIGLQEQINIMYQWLSKNYLPGDKIMLFGFSRGAYTVRALNGMIAQVGLLKPEYATEQKVKEAAALYSEKRVVKVTRVANALKNAKDDTGGSRFPNLQWGPREILSFAATAFLSRDANEKVVKNVSVPFREQYCVAAPAGQDSTCYPPVYFIGAYDTVKSTGLSWLSPLLTPRNLDGTNQGPNYPVKGCQAIATTERRYVFRPLLWDEIPYNGAPASFSTKFEQIWFRGTHGSVGGGAASKKDFYKSGEATGSLPGDFKYPENGPYPTLSAIPFLWMLKKARDHANDEESCARAGVSSQSLLLKKPYRLLLKLDYARAMNAVKNGKSYRSTNVKWFYANPLLREPDSRSFIIEAFGWVGKVNEFLWTQEVSALKSGRLLAVLRGDISNFYPASPEAVATNTNEIKIHDSVKVWLDVHIRGKKVVDYQKPLITDSSYERERATQVQSDLDALGEKVNVRFNEF